MPSSRPSASNPTVGIESHIAAQLAQPIRSLDEVSGGRNSKVLRTVCSDGSTYATKIYPPVTPGGRDRQATESTALAFLAANAVDNIPGIVRTDREFRCTILSWIEGSPIHSVAPNDVETAVQFISTLHRLSDRPAAADLPIASEACFSGIEILRQIDSRLDRVNRSAKGEGELSEFLTGEFVPALAKMRAEAEQSAAEHAIDLKQEIPTNERTLSPSDFGFHNALRRNSGEILFLDFEYFGWDDPVKLAADFLLHPAMTLDEEMSQLFLKGVARQFSPSGDFLRRLEVFLPLYGLRWCLILLNEFCAEDWGRRSFAEPTRRKIPAKREQLEKSRRMLSRTLSGFDWLFDDF